MQKAVAHQPNPSQVALPDANASCSPSSVARATRCHAAETRLLQTGHQRRRCRASFSSDREPVSRAPPTLSERCVPAPNLRVLDSICSGNKAAYSRALHDPVCLEALTAPQLPTWWDFLSSYGCSNDVMLKVLYDYPELFNSDIYTAGEAILFFKSYGWKDRDVRLRIMPQWPHLLAKSVSHDFIPIVTYLERGGCKGRHLRLLVWEYPRIFLSKDFRRQASRFARLGCYGLDPSSLRAGDSHPYTHEGMHEGESERSHAHTVTLASGWRGSSPEALSFWP